MIPKKLNHKRKPAKRGTPAHKVYMAKVAQLPCCLYEGWPEECQGRVTVAHKDGAGMALKSSDYDTFPCCEAHHLFGPNSITYLGVRRWERKYGLQKDFIAQTQVTLQA